MQLGRRGKVYKSKERPKILLACTLNKAMWVFCSHAHVHTSILGAYVHVYFFKSMVSASIVHVILIHSCSKVHTLGGKKERHVSFGLLSTRMFLFSFGSAPSMSPLTGVATPIVGSPFAIIQCPLIRSQ